MKCKDIIDFLEKDAPLFLQEDYDNSGLQLGNPENNVNKVLVCLDFTQDALNTAIAENVQMVISHHPVIFRPIKAINTRFGIGKMLSDCIRKDITVYSAHTNFDIAWNGLNDFLARSLDLIDIIGLKAYCNESLSKLTESIPMESLRTAQDEISYSMGRVGKLRQNLKPVEFIAYVKEKLNAESVRTVGFQNKKEISAVAVFCGSFDGDVGAIVSKKADSLVTGDLKYHDAQALSQSGIFAIDAGHYNTEKLFIKAVSDMLIKKFKDVIIIEHYGQDIFDYK